jgi:multimeric flavodoxin WrbA
VIIKIGRNIMNKTFKIITILGSPHDKKSNTRALVEDFVDEMSSAGLDLEHEVISLGRKNINPCRGCWNCTGNRPCPIDDDLTSVKESLLESDMVILASPVYTNQVSAQMKAFCDRLFTWCHVFPLLGKYSLSAVTTGNDGYRETGEFLEKMLATYGTRSFGTIYSIGGFTPGFFPWREQARQKNRKMAVRAVKMIQQNKLPKVKPILYKMFKAMKHKMHGMHAVNSMVNGEVKNQPKPLWLRVRVMQFFMKKMKITDKQLQKWAGFMSFELSWWRDRGWLRAGNFKQLADMKVPDNFDIKTRLLEI